MRKRSQSRDWALKILYQVEIARKPAAEVCDDFLAQQENKDAETIEFARYLALGTRENLDAIDQKISQHATNWQLKRMAVIDKNILRLGVFELDYASGVPPKVVINESIELAKKYGDIDSGKFINGVLDKIHKTQPPQQEKT